MHSVGADTERFVAGAVDQGHNDIYLADGATAISAKRDASTTRLRTPCMRTAVGGTLVGSHFYQGTIVRSPSVETPPEAFRPLVKCAFDHHPAGMAELVDAPDSKSGVRKDVRVRVPFPVHKSYAHACVPLRFRVLLSGRCPINRVERKLLSIGDRLQALRRDRADVVAELDELREIAVESESDATYYDEAIDRAEARLTAGDVSRFERLLAKLDSERDHLERRRVRLLDKL